MRTGAERRTAPALAGNGLLAGLAPAERAPLLALCTPVALSSGQVLYEPGEPITTVYFPDDCLISLLALAEQRLTLEVGAVGPEGVVGAALALGQTRAQVRAVVQRAGRARSVAGADFCRAYAASPPLQQLLQRYTGSLLAQTIQIAVCSRFHMLEARLARSLLLMRERLRSESFYLTHEVLAHALGVRRVGVTKAASALQQQKLISYSRGHIVILDPAGLEALSCSCYQLVREGGPLGPGRRAP